VESRPARRRHAGRKTGHHPEDERDERGEPMCWRHLLLLSRSCPTMTAGTWPAARNQSTTPSLRGRLIVLPHYCPHPGPVRFGTPGGEAVNWKEACHCCGGRPPLCA